jgi:hypothetical protein
MGFRMKSVSKMVKKAEPGAAPASSGGKGKFGIRGMMARAIGKAVSQGKGPVASLAGKAIEAKKGGMIKKKSASDMAGRAMKKTSADAKGRAMRKGK